MAVRKRLAADSPAPQPGETIIYEIKVQNYGAQSTTNVTLMDELPARFICLRRRRPRTAYVGRTLTWDLGDVRRAAAAPGTRDRRYPLMSLTTPSSSTPSRCTAPSPIPSPNNNGFEHRLTVRDDVDLTMDKTGVGLPAIGAEYTYYLDYANWGGAPASGVVRHRPVARRGRTCSRQTRHPTR